MISKVWKFLKSGNNKKITVLIASIYNTIYRSTRKIRGRGNIIDYRGNFLKNCNIVINGHNNTIKMNKCGMNSLINCSIHIYGNNNTIYLGELNTFNKADLWIEDDGNSILFGDKNKIRGFTHVACIEGCKVVFGNGSLFSTNVIFRTGDSHSILDKNTDKRINPSKSINIGDRVWFGNNTTILKGTKISNDSIVATGTIVTKSFLETNIIIGGLPSKILKENIKWIQERIL